MSCAADLFDLCHQCREVHRESAGKPVDIDHSNVPPATFDVAHVPRVKARRLRQTLLREVASESEGPNRLTESDEDFGGSIGGHVPTLRDSVRTAPCTMSGPWCGFPLMSASSASTTRCHFNGRRP